ncbi:MAG: hypothetical protein HYX66_05500 [Ignavibacteria bacterium]|nr:hypothetical protein [Ignavibacteria bacterium]
MMDSPNNARKLHLAPSMSLVRSTRGYLVYIFVVVSMFLVPMALYACPGCKQGYAPESVNAAVGDAYSMSVIFMLAVPATLVTVFTIVLTRRLRNIEKK